MNITSQVNRYSQIDDAILERAPFWFQGSACLLSVCPNIFECQVQRVTFELTVQHRVWEECFIKKEAAPGPE